MSAALFDLTPTEDQQMTQDMVRRFVADVMAPQARAADEAAALPAGFLDQVFELGFSFMPVPEDLGGAGEGRRPVSNVLLMENLAAGDLSMAVAALAPLSVINCLLDYGNRAQQERVFRVLNGSAFVPAALALHEPGVITDPRAPATTATKAGDGYVLQGTKSMVEFGPDARFILVTALLDDGVAAFLLDTDNETEGLSFQPEQYMGLRSLPLFQMTLDKVLLPATARLDEGFCIDGLLQRGRIAAAALATGTCQAVLDYVVPYVNERVAFGEPISNRQAVAFMVVDMATELEAMQLLNWRAAAQLEQGADCARAAYLAQRHASKYGMKIGTDGVQLFGGHGFIREHPLEMWYRNLRAVPLLGGLVLA